MHSNAMHSGASGQAESYDRAEANHGTAANGQLQGELNGQPDGIPEATVARLPVYLRALYGLAERGISTVASEELAAAAGVNSAKLRKDLSHLGSYGIRGVGYDVDYLVYQGSRTLGLTQDWPVVLVGAGQLGPAPGSRPWWPGTTSPSASSPPRPGPRRPSATGSSRPASPASSISLRSC